MTSIACLYLIGGCVMGIAYVSRLDPDDDVDPVDLGICVLVWPLFLMAVWRGWWRR